MFYGQWNACGNWRVAGRLLLLALLIFWPTAGCPEPANGGAYRLLILDSQWGNPYDEVRAALLKRLAEAGYRPDDTLQVVTHAAGNDIDQGVEILNKEIPNGFDVVFVGGTVATIAAKRALLGQEQPVVFGAPTDPVGIGVIDDFTSPPKANFTGVCYPVPVQARLRFTRLLLPQARTFGLIYADMPQSHSYNAWLQDLLANSPEFQDINIIFRPVPLVTGEDGDQRMAELAIPIIQELNDQVDAFLKPNDQLGTRRQFAETVLAHATKPLVGIVRDDVMGQWGATAVVYPSHESIGRQAAAMIQRLFEGDHVAEIPPEWPAKFGYAVNLSLMRRFGLSTPVGLLRLAGENIIR